MAKGKNAPAPAGATSNEVEEVKIEAVQTEEVVEETVQEDAQEVVEEVNEVSVINPKVFIAEDGTELEFDVHHFICPNGKKYTVAQAIAEAPEVLEVLYKANSFIFKK
jgi:hypothetical protein